MAVRIVPEIGPLRALATKLVASEATLRADIAIQLYGAAEDVMTASKEICPVDTGALKSTGVVLKPQIKADAVEVVLGYGGPAKDGRAKGRSGRKRSDDVGYAWHVHENLRGAHFHGNGQAKYLERPLMEKVNRIAQAIANGLVSWSKL